MMPRWETYGALLAVIFAALGALTFPGHLYLTCAAVALIAVVGVSRLRAHYMRRRGPAASDAAERAQKIRDARRRR